MGKNTESARASTAPWAQSVPQRLQVATVIYLEVSRSLVILFDAIAAKRDSHVRVPIKSQESAVWVHPEYWFESLCVSGTACLLPSFPPHLPPVTAGCVAVLGRLDSRYWCCSKPAGNPSWSRSRRQGSSGISMVDAHRSISLDALSRRKPRFAAIPEGHGKTATSALNHRQKEPPRQEQGE